MSNGDNFAGGFVVGAVLGGLLGGVFGAALVSRSGQTQDEEALSGSAEDSLAKPRRRWLSTARVGSEERIEEARTGLEEKIAQLNAAIDEARQQLSETENLSRPEQNGGQTLGLTQNHSE